MKKIIFILIAVFFLMPAVVSGQSIFNELPKQVGDVRDNVVNQGKQILEDSAKEAVDTAKEGVKGAIQDQIDRAAEEARDQVDGFFQKIKNFFGKIISEIKNSWRIGTENIIRKLNSIRSWLSD